MELRTLSRNQCRLLAVGIATRLRPSTILYMDLFGRLVCVGVILLWPTSVAVLWIGAMTLGLSTASVFPTTLILAAERMHLTGTVTGWFLVGGGVGGMFWPWLIGRLFEPIGLAVTMAIIFAATSMNLAVLFALITRPRRR